VPAGVFKTRYEDEISYIKYPIHKVGLTILILFLATYPLLVSGNPYYVGLAVKIAVFFTAAIGLNILTGLAGQISLGHAAFLAIGAYTVAYLSNNINVLGREPLLTLPIAGVVAVIAGLIIGIPSLRVKRLYLALTTLVFQYAVLYVISNPRWENILGGGWGLSVSEPSFFGFKIPLKYRDIVFYYFTVMVAFILAVLATNISRSMIGRAWKAIRDRDIAAEVLGVNLFKYKLLAFMVSAFYAAIAGGIWAYYQGHVSPEDFDLMLSIDFVAIILIGGLGRIVWGSLLGTFIVVSVPEIISVWVLPALQEINPAYAGMLPPLREIIFGVLVASFLLYESKGLVELLRKIKEYFRLWPFQY